MAEFIQGTKPKGVFTKKAIKIACQNISVITVIKSYMHFWNFCEFDTYVGIIDDLGVSIVFFLNGDARLGSGLLKYEILRSKSQSVRL